MSIGINKRIIRLRRFQVHFSFFALISDEDTVFRFLREMSFLFYTFGLSDTPPLGVIKFFSPLPQYVQIGFNPSQE